MNTYLNLITRTKGFYLVFSGFFLLLVSCANMGFNQTKSGLSYKIIGAGASKKAQIGDFVVVDLITKNSADSVLENTWLNHRARKVIVQKPNSIRDFNEIILMLGEKDSAIVKIPVDSLFKGNPIPKEIKAGSSLTFYLKVQHVIPQNQIQAYLSKEKEDAEKTEKAGLDKYIKDHNLKPITTASGLNYIISKQGTGPKPVAGDTVVVNYTGRLLNGKIFDTNSEDLAKQTKTFNMQRKMQKGYDPIHFPIGVNAVIKGWDEALLLLNKGTKAQLLFPSNLGYGERGASADIGPYSTLIFDVELVDVIKGKGVPKTMPGMQINPNGK